MTGGVEAYLTHLQCVHRHGEATSALLDDVTAPPPVHTDTVRLLLACCCDCSQESDHADHVCVSSQENSQHGRVQRAYHPVRVVGVS